MSGHQHSTPEEVLGHLYPTLFECFGIIFIGYVVGRFNIVSPSQGRGIGKFVTKIALPAVIFKSLTEVKFGLVDWSFWLSIAVSKALVFLLVTSVTLLFGKDVGKAGVYGIFVTQSNDLALGVPLFDAIYRNYHPELVGYLYLLIPVSVAILNPVGFAFLEYYHVTSNGDMKESKLLSVMKKVFVGIITNPLIFMVILGLIGNFVFNQKIPAVLEPFFTVLSQSFGATALFALGLSMVGKMKKYTGFTLVVPMVLIMMKSLFLPLLMREAVYVFSGAHTNTTEVQSSFAFLYGTLPTAPPVALYAVAYDCEVDTMASSMVLGTVLALPIMLVSSIMMSVSSNKATMNFMQVISDMSFDVCFVSIACCIWVCVMLILVKSVKKVPHRYTFCIVICQALMSVSIALTRIEFDAHGIAMVISGLFVIGLIGCHCWVAILAYTLYLLRCKGEQSAKQNSLLIMLLGWSVPVITALILVPLIPAECLHLSSEIMLIDFRLHKSFNAASIVVLVATTLATITFLALLMRGDKFCQCKNKPSLDPSAEPLLSEMVPTDKCDRCQYLIKQSPEQFLPGLNNRVSCPGKDDPAGPACCSTSTSTNIEDIASSRCLLKRASSLRSYNSIESSNDSSSLSDAESISMDEYYQGEKHQLSRHVIFILLLTLVAIINLFLCLWRLLGDKRFGIYLEMEFLLAFCTFGQGFISFAIFGFHKELFSVSEQISKLFQSCKRKKTVVLKPLDALPPHVVRLCNGFSNHHKDRCQKELVKKIRCRLRMYNNSFRGTELIDWLIDNGLSINRHSAVKYGNHLLQGRVISHITGQHLFYDLPYFYQFSSDEEQLNDTASISNENAFTA